MKMYDKKLDKYIGKKFNYGKVDCYSLIREFYKDEFGLELTDYARPDYWWNNGGNLYMDNFRNEGFRLLGDNEELQYGDVLLIALGCSVASHGAIYIGNNLILQHCQNHISSIDRYMGVFKDRTLAKVRHKSIAEKGKVGYELNEDSIYKFTKFVHNNRK